MSIKAINTLKRSLVRRLENLASLPTWIWLLLFSPYLLAMFFFPWFIGSLDWDYVQGVWDRWQALNVGILALAASIVVFKAAQLYSNEQKRRELAAASSFLPEVLDPLKSYLFECAQLYKVVWDAAISGRNLTNQYPVQGPGVYIAAPGFPVEHRAVFRDCIRHAEPELGDFLANLVSELQIHHIYLKGFVEKCSEPRKSDFFGLELVTRFVRVAELRAEVQQLVFFTSRRDEFVYEPLTWKEFTQSYSGLKISVEEIEWSNWNLKEATEARIRFIEHEYLSARKKSQAF